MNLPDLVAVVDRKRYNTETAKLLADDDYWDGHNRERDGRNTWLMQTPKGAYFLVHGSLWQGERDRIEPLTESEAIQWFERLPEKYITWEEQFPGVVQDA